MIQFVVDCLCLGFIRHWRHCHPFWAFVLVVASIFLLSVVGLLALGFGQLLHPCFEGDDLLLVSAGFLPLICLREVGELVQCQLHELVRSIVGAFIVIGFFEFRVLDEGLDTGHRVSFEQV